MALSERDQQIIDMRRAGKRNIEIQEALGLSVGTVSGVINRNKSLWDDSVRPSNVISVENWQGGIETDVELWRETQARIERDHRYVRVVFDSDAHFPFEDSAALALRLRLRQLFQPHIGVRGGDDFDFPEISRFGQDKRIDNTRWLSKVRKPYWEYVRRLAEVAPGCKEVFLTGNHDERAYLELEKEANYDVLLEYHVNTIRAGGYVHWLGTGDDALEINIADTLILTHGWKATKHTAAGMLTEYDNQYSVICGHTHRPDYYTTVTRYAVEAAVSGCGCEVKPHYERRKKRTKWQQGYVMATVDTHTRTAQIHNLRFSRSDGHLWTMFGGEIVSVPLAQAQEGAA